MACMVSFPHSDTNVGKISNKVWGFVSLLYKTIINFTISSKPRYVQCTYVCLLEAKKCQRFAAKKAESKKAEQEWVDFELCQSKLQRRLWVLFFRSKILARQKKIVKQKTFVPIHYFEYLKPKPTF